MILSLLVWLAMLPYNSVDCDPQMRNGKEYQQCAVDAPAEQTPDLSQLTDPGIVRPLPQLTKCIDNGDDTTTCPNSLLRVIIDHVELPKPKPAEHVIEIKTRRESDSVCLDLVDKQCDKLCRNPDHTGSMEGLTRAIHCHLCEDRANIEMQKCERVTRELWIDGQKFGVIKGLD